MILYDFDPTVHTLQVIRQFATLERAPRLCGANPIIANLTARAVPHEASLAE
jgi:hypothetical protein